MRAAAGLLLIVTLSMAGSQARAQGLVDDPRAKTALFTDVFASGAESQQSLALTPFVVAPKTRPDLAALATGAVFAAPVQDVGAPDNAHLLAVDLPAPGRGLAVWRSNEVILPARSGGAVDAVRISLGGVAYAPGGIVLARPDGLLATDTQSFDLNYTRGWPAALALSAGRYDLDISPHAGVGVSNDGGSAEAGALVRLGPNLQDRVMSGLGALGLHTVSSRSLGDRGRWYLFASASGRAVGLNVARDAQGSLQRLGWSAEGTSELISDAQAGIAWRKGTTQASLGYVHREIHGDFGGNVDPGR